MNRETSNQRSGFTIIELMLAMSFVSVLLIAIAMTVIQIGGIYNRGLTLKSVNQAGRMLTSELQRSIASSMVFDVSAAPGSQWVKQEWGGRLCTGSYTYVWNYGNAIDKDDSRLNKYSDSDDTIRFTKVYDPSVELCTDPNVKPPVASAVELLNIGENNLAVHNFSISSSSSDPKTRQRLYSVNFVIGTNNQEAIDANHMTCKPPSDKESDLTYCSVNSFSIVVHAGNVVE
jgi:type II secretory pathway pseudopilin PulG